MIYTFSIPGPSCPQGSSRGFIVGGKVRVVSANKGLAAWRSHAVRCIHEQIGTEAAWVPLTGPLRVTLNDHRARPKGRPKKAVWADRQPDLDKIMRAVGDLLEGAGVCRSDGQICWIEAKKFYADRPMVVITVEEIP